MKIAQRWIGLMSLLFSAGLWAAEAVQPLEGHHAGKAGDIQTGSFVVTNVLTYDLDAVLSPAELPNSGDAIQLATRHGLALEGPSAFRLKVGESRSIPYRVTFPTPFDKPAAGAISLVLRKAGDALSTPLLNRLLPIYLQPLGNKQVSLKLDLDQPNIRFVSATGEVQGPKHLEVSVLLRNSGGDALKPQGRVDFRMNNQSLDVIPLQGTVAIPPNGTAIYSGLTHRTQWPSGSYEAHVTLDYGDYYGSPQSLKKNYLFQVSGEIISVQPGSSPPAKVTPR